MQTAHGHILTINGGSSSIKFAVYRSGKPPGMVVTGEIERIGEPETVLRARGADGGVLPEVRVEADAADALLKWLGEQLKGVTIGAVGHRVVHGGVRLLAHQVVTEEVLAELRRAVVMDRAHLPREIALLESFGKKLAGVPQVVCFDTAFHRELPRVAQLLPIPLAYNRAGVRRFGFHGLSYTYLMAELERQAGGEAARGRVILAHLGSGASMAAVHRGKPVDTTMGFTPTAGVVMGTRPGDFDAGLLLYLMRSEGMSADQADELINRRCGLAGMSETSGDIRDLQARRATDVRASDALEVFYQSARKNIAALAASLGGVETLVFSGGIGEHSHEARAAICQGLSFLGVEVDESRNKTGAAVISAEGGRVVVRVIATNEEVVIAESVMEVLGW